MSESEGQILKRSPLDALHRERGARMVPFAGYEMPVQYKEGIIAEHLHTRKEAGLFDVSHMGQAILRGDDAAAALETLSPGDIQSLSVGKSRYTVLTNEDGGIIDDLIVTNHANHLHLVVNAACKEGDYRHIVSRLEGRCALEKREDRGLLALQGPDAADVMGRLAPACRHLLFMTAESLKVAGVPCLVSRTGYTGEDGYEISVPAEEAEHLARLLLDEPEVKLIGLGARDSLRLEAGLCLYGSDINETTTPVEAGLTWTISKRRRAEGGFPGAGVIIRQINEGVGRRRVGIRLEGKIPARAHALITDRTGAVIGEVTSGGYGPSVGGPIAMGYVGGECAEPGTEVNLMVRDRPLPGRVEKLPFVEHRYVKR
ncbi:MAG: glycine cleavage system protein T [Rhodospirillales bacterium RIFCSPLOWO2_12_FULL_58_28]|nr:MAG: glycine cleavage system protein T [Rhodospirillales bacterium RIFCSPLOWO2_02_FULL_58_16]OHC79424.1 MAG: glycine cleavage system protein T [Rhodospirillales bacterium RIFCSPLOWO2_12_FULL_58_28]